MIRGRKITYILLTTFSIIIIGYNGINFFDEWQKERQEVIIKAQNEVEAIRAASEKKINEMQIKVDEMMGIQKDKMVETEEKLEAAQKQTNALSAKIKELQDAPPKEIIKNGNATVVNPYIQAIVALACIQPGGDIYWGTGTFRTTDGKILTNAHVVGAQNSLCAVYFTLDPNYAPQLLYAAVPEAINSEIDLATLKTVYDKDLNPITLKVVNPIPPLCKASNIYLGSNVYIAGYPAAAGNTLTITDGIISGFDGNYIKTSAKIDHGNSGGMALHESGCFLGVPTMVYAGTLESYGFIISMVQ